MALNSRILALSILLLVLSLQWTNVASQNPPNFACDLDKNPILKKYAFCDSSLKVKTRVNDLVRRLTLEEKIGYLVDKASSIERLGIAKYNWWSEALHGLSNIGHGTSFSDLVPGATSFPQVILTAASFNETLFKTIGKVPF